MKAAAVLLALMIAGCANPLNRATSDRYSDECAEAERQDNLQAAEVLCYRALANVDMGNLGPELKSERMYNLARIKRRLAKFAEAEYLLKESLSIEEPLSGPSSLKAGRRLAELAANLAAQDKWNEGLPLVERLLPLTDSYAGHEREFLGVIFREYASRASAAGKTQLAAALQAKAGQ